MPPLRFHKDPKIISPIILDEIIKIGKAVDCIPPKPAIILVAAPVIDCLAIELTGLVPVPYNAIKPIPKPAKRPMTVAKKTPSLVNTSDFEQMCLEDIFELKHKSRQP